MPTLKKVKTTFYAVPVDPSAKRPKWKKVPKGTVGSQKVTVESKKWYIVFKEFGKVRRVPAYTDKQASQTKMAGFLRAKERGESGLSDPYKRHYDRPIAEHIGQYHAHLVAHSKEDSKDPNEILRILSAAVAGMGVKSIREITPDRVAMYLTGMTQAAVTKNKHRGHLVTFCNWLELKGRMPANPIGGKKVKRFKSTDENRKRKRRALSLGELQRLLAAAREQPLNDARVGRGGRWRGDGTRKDARPAWLKPATVAKLETRGRERGLLYRLAIYTGLRRNELSRLRVRHLHLDRSQPVLDLPGECTKNGKRALIPLVPSLVSELKSWLADSRRGANAPVLAVPDKSNLSKIHQRLLIVAGITYKDEAGRYADFHSLRKAANVLLRRAGIELKDRMTFLRHGSAALTDGVYDDEDQTDKTGIINALQDAAL